MSAASITSIIKARNAIALLIADNFSDNTYNIHFAHEVPDWSSHSLKVHAGSTFARQNSNLFIIYIKLYGTSFLAHMSKFIIVEITESKSELISSLPSIVRILPSIPVIPIIQRAYPDNGYFEIKRYPWVLTLIEYQNSEELIASFDEIIIARAEAKIIEMKRLLKKYEDTLTY